MADGKLVVDRLGVEIGKLEYLILMTKAARERAIRKYEPERCCSGCNYIAGREEEFIDCSRFKNEVHNG